MEKFFEAELWRALVVLIPLAVVLGICAYTDWKERKVFNKIVYPSIGIGIVAHTAAFGLDGFTSALIGGGLAFIFGFICWMIPPGMIKAGDVKLLAAVGAFVGLRGVGQIFFYAVIAGGFGGIILSIFNGYFVEMMKNIFRFFRGIFRAVGFGSSQFKEEMVVDERSWMPFAVWTFVGAGIAVADVFYKWPDWFHKVMVVWGID